MMSVKSQKGAKLENDKVLKSKTEYRLNQEFLENPYMLPITLTNRRIMIPMIMVSEYRNNYLEGGLPIKKSESEMKDDFNMLAINAWPVVAFDPVLKEVGVKEDVMNYAIVNTFSDHTKMMFFKGLRFLIFEYHEVVAFVEKDSLSLLSSEIPISELEKQEQLENESSVQSDKA